MKVQSLDMNPMLLKKQLPISSSAANTFKTYGFRNTMFGLLAARMLVIALCMWLLLPLGVWAQHPDTTDWKDLFAADLSNTVDPAGWTFEGKELVAKNHDTLWTKESYGDFILDLEFKVAAEANSGVFLRSGDIKNVLAALEIQVHENADGSKYGMVAAIYDAMPPSKKAAKPVGQWNRYTITCKGPQVTVVLNGEKVIDANLDNWPEVGKNPDGTPNKFKKALKDFARSGPIGLQGLHGKAQAPVWYRNLKIKVLN